MGPMGPGGGPMGPMGPSEEAQPKPSTENDTADSGEPAAAHGRVRRFFPESWLWSDVTIGYKPVHFCVLDLTTAVWCEMSTVEMRDVGLESLYLVEVYRCCSVV